MEWSAFPIRYVGKQNTEDRLEHVLVYSTSWNMEFQLMLKRVVYTVYLVIGTNNCVLLIVDSTRLGCGKKTCTFSLCTLHVACYVHEQASRRVF